MRSLVFLNLLALSCAPAHSPKPRPQRVEAAPAPPARASDEPVLGGWSAKLADPAERVRTITELQTLYEDTRVQANRDPAAPEVRALVDRIVKPLTHAYVAYYAELDVDTRVRLIRLLAELGDPRIAPAVNKAFDEFAARPTGDRHQTDILWAARATAALELSSTADALLRAFLALRASTVLGGLTYRDVNAAMLAVARDSFVAPLLSVLQVSMKTPRDARDTASIEAYRDQLFWQATAAQVLGELRTERALEPLMQVMLDRDKADLHSTTILALVKLGKIAVPRAARSLEREASRPTAALILGTIGRPEAAPALIDALKNAPATTRAIIARELTKLPADPTTIAAFKKTFESTPASTEVPPDFHALTMLAEAAGQLYEPALVDWLLDRATKARGSELRSALLITAIKLVQPHQLKKVKASVTKLGGTLELGLFAAAEALTQRCATDAACFVREMASEANQTEERQFIGIKASYMAAILGNEQTRAAIVSELDAYENPAVRFTAAQAIDRLSPSGSKPVAAAVLEVVRRNAETLDPSRIAADAPLKQVAYRVRARAD